MKRFLSLLHRILPHAVLILSLMMLVLFCIDTVNGAMAFLNNAITKYLLALLAFLAGVLAIFCILNNEK